MRNEYRTLQRWALALAVSVGLGCLLTARATAGEFPVPWPPPGTNEPPTTPPPDTAPPPPTTDIPPVVIPPDTNPPVVVPPPGDGEPPAGSPPPEVPPPDVPTPEVPPPSVHGTPEPASVVIGLIGIGAGIFATRRKRKN